MNTITIQIAEKKLTDYTTQSRYYRDRLWAEINRADARVLKEAGVPVHTSELESDIFWAPEWAAYVLKSCPDPKSVLRKLVLDRTARKALATILSMFDALDKKQACADFCALLP